MSAQSAKNIVLSINKVEPGLVAATKKLADSLGKTLSGVCIVSKESYGSTSYMKDESGFFEEIICDFDNLDELQQITKQFMDNVLAVNCRSESAIQDFVKIIPFIPYVSTPTESSLVWATEKGLMRNRLHAYDPSLVPQYRYVEEIDIENIDELIHGMEFPMIVKPNGLNSSILVTLCRHKEELVFCLEKTFSVIHSVYEKERGTGAPSLLIEEFMVGDMYSIDAYIDPQGVVSCLPPVRVFTAHDKGLEGFHGYQFELPSTLSTSELNKAYDAAVKSVKALNLRSCTTHIELYNCDGKWKIIELGPRIGGHREDLYREAYGIDHYYNDLASRIGLPLELPDKPKKHAICMDLYPDEEGHIESFQGIEEGLKLQSTVHIKPHFKKGDLALFAANGGAYVVDALLSNENLDQLHKDANKLREIIKINTVPHR